MDKFLVAQKPKIQPVIFHTIILMALHAKEHQQSQIKIPITCPSISIFILNETLLLENYYYCHNV